MIFLLLLAALPPVTSPITDNLPALVAETPAGGTLSLPAGATYRVTSPLVLNRSIRIEGHGARIVAADGARIEGAVIASDGVDRIMLDDLTIDANVDQGGGDYGVWIRGGSGHRMTGLRIANTSQACLLLEDASGVIESNILNRCGRALTIRRGGAANNHGIMVVALARDVADITIARNAVSQTYRKGITTYTRSPGSLSNVTITDNHISGAGLGGIFVANAPGASAVHTVAIRGNTVSASYVGYEIDNVVDLTLVNNLADDMRDRNGRPGAEGLVLHAVRNADIQGIAIRNSGSGGITVIDSRNIRVSAPSIVDGNSGNYGYAPGIQLRSSRNVNVSDISIIDTRAHPALTHGFVEMGPAANNHNNIKRMEGILRPALRIER